MLVSARVTVFAAVVVAFAGPAAATPDRGHEPTESSYRVQLLEPAAGDSSSGATINNRGQVAGQSDASDGSVHAAVWRDGEPEDLGALGGPGASSAVLWPVKNNRGVVVGISQTDTPDPNREPWSCSAFLPDRLGFACVGFVWRNGEMKALPTLGGTHGFATSINNRNQIVGWAENTVVDDSCSEEAGQVLQFRAVRWDRLGQRTTELKPLPGDRVSAATAINDRERVVGISGMCDQAVGRSSAQDAVVWDRGVVRRLPDLGGVAWNTPMALNRKGDAAGFLNRSREDGINLRPLPVWWSADGTLHRLTLPDGYPFGQALGINSRRQIVGVALSADFQQRTAVLWEHGQAIVLEDEAAGGLDLRSASDINERGEITGAAVHPETGATVAYLAHPEKRRAGR